MYRRITGLMSIMVVLMLILTACGGTNQSGAKPAAPESKTEQPAARPEPVVAKPTGKVTIYSSASKDLLDAMTPVLKAKYPELEVEWVYGGTEELVDKLSAEFAAGSVAADAIMMADPAYARLLKDQGLLTPYTPAAVDKVKVDRDPEGYYTAVRVLDVVIVYNPDLVKPEEAPKSFKDLLDPKWKGQVALSDPTKSGTAFATVGALVNTYGWAYFETAQANDWQVGGSSSSPVKKVGEGKAKVAITVESTYQSAKAKGSKGELVWPEDGAIVMESPYAILKSTKNLAGAKAVIDWLITPEAQSMITKAGMHPVISGVEPPANSRPLDQILKNNMKVDWIKLSKEKGQIQDKFLQVVPVKPN
ncbi:MAG TPA: ABC transporter substrate-binding protein [Symbiobacteriaceae bacterium]|nr:ABC transporter substrate-binding protein [Symbiobacteriaceae bacterium]